MFKWKGEQEVTTQTVAELEAMKVTVGALQELEEPAQRRVLTWLVDALGVESFAPVPSPSASPVLPEPDEVGLGTAREFLARKAPRTDIERVACLAYYLRHGRDTGEFETKDLSDLNTEAAGPRFSNVAYTASNAVKKNGYLAPAPNGKRQITPRGEALVEALPDREAVSGALEAFPNARRRVSGSKKRKAGNEQPEG
jgi:hypothetical protein